MTSGETALLTSLQLLLHQAIYAMQSDLLATRREDARATQTLTQADPAEAPFLACSECYITSEQLIELSQLCAC